jgi:hypothetical protein
MILRELFGYLCVMKIPEDIVNLIPTQEALETLFRPHVLACAFEEADTRVVGVYKGIGC